MLKSINTKYIWLALLLYLIYLPAVEEHNMLLYIFNVFSVPLYYFMLNINLAKPESFLTSRRLSLIVLIYSLVFVCAFNILSYIYTHNFFVFSEMDAVVYDKFSVIMAPKSLIKSIHYYLHYYQIEDLGAVLVISILYRIIESNLFVNLFYVIIGVFTAIGIFNISKNIMSVKYAFLCSLAYSISSFVLWFHSSGLKESFMIMLIVGFFDQYYKYIKNPKIGRFVYGTLYVAPLMFFRPVLIFLCLGSVLMGLFLRLKLNMASFLAILLLSSVVIFSFSYFMKASEQFVPGGPKAMILSKATTEMVKISLPFTYAVNIMSVSIGPLPTLLPTKKWANLSIYSVGLIYRVFISLAFWFGIYYAYKSKATYVYPIIVFSLLEMVSLAFILEGVSLRKSFPHLFGVYIVSFWFLDTFNSSTILKPHVKYRINRLVNVSIVLFSLAIIMWNKRGM